MGTGAGLPPGAQGRDPRNKRVCIRLLRSSSPSFCPEVVKAQRTGPVVCCCCCQSVKARANFPKREVSRAEDGGNRQASWEGKPCGQDDEDMVWEGGQGDTVSTPPRKPSRINSLIPLPGPCPGLKPCTSPHLEFRAMPPTCHACLHSSTGRVFQGSIILPHFKS